MYKISARISLKTIPIFIKLIEHLHSDLKTKIAKHLKLTNHFINLIILESVVEFLLDDFSMDISRIQQVLQINV